MSFDLPVVHNPSNTVLQARLQTLIDNKTKPLASLGRLEALAVQIGVALGTESPVLEEPQVYCLNVQGDVPRSGHIEAALHTCAQVVVFIAVFCMAAVLWGVV